MKKVRFEHLKKKSEKSKYVFMKKVRFQNPKKTK